MNFTKAIYRLNIMFRHMSVPRDTSVSRQIIIVCCESVGICQTLSKDGPSQLVNSIIFRPFFSFLCVRCPSFLTNFVPFRRALTTCFSHCFHVFQWTALYITWYSVTCDCIFGFLRKGQSWICVPQCEFWLLIS